MFIVQAHTGPSGEVVLCPEQTRAERSRRALARALKRVPENVMIALVCVMS